MVLDGLFPGPGVGTDKIASWFKLWPKILSARLIRHLQCIMWEGPFCLLRKIARGKVAWWRIATRSVGIAANNCANCPNLPIFEAKRCIGTVPNDWQEFNIAKIVVGKSAPNCCQLSQREWDQSKPRYVVSVYSDGIFSWNGVNFRVLVNIREHLQRMFSSRPQK